MKAKSIIAVLLLLLIIVPITVFMWMGIHMDGSPNTTSYIILMYLISFEVFLLILFIKPTSVKVSLPIFSLFILFPILLMQTVNLLKNTTIEDRLKYTALFITRQAVQEYYSDQSSLPGSLDEIIENKNRNNFRQDFEEHINYLSKSEGFKYTIISTNLYSICLKVKTNYQLMKLLYEGQYTDELLLSQSPSNQLFKSGLNCIEYSVYGYN